MANQKINNIENFGSEFQEVLKNLELFIRKFYKNKIITGTAISLITLSLFFLMAVVVEYYTFLSSTIRTIIYFTYLIVFFVLFFTFVLFPFFKLFSFGKRINTDKAVLIISTHFSEIEDKLINVLQLAQQAKSSNQNELLIAAIQQKASQLKLFDFRLAINFRINIKYFKYLAAIFLVVISIGFISPDILTDGSHRILNPTQDFQPEAPYQFSIINDSLQILKGDDITVHVKSTGKYQPDNVYISYGTNRFLMQKAENNSEYFYEFKSVNNDFKFTLETKLLKSKLFQVTVLPVPLIMNAKILVIPPAYTQLKSEMYTNVSDIKLPYGSICKWNMEAAETSKMNFLLGDSSTLDFQFVDKYFEFKKQIFKSDIFTVNIKNDFVQKDGFLSYNVTVIPDLFPAIQVQQMADSASNTLFYFKGSIQDDYGFSKLRFVTEVKEKTGKLISKSKQVIDIGHSYTQQTFFFQKDLDSLVSKPETDLLYYFEIADNDIFHGGKITKSDLFRFHVPSSAELEQMNDEQTSSIKEKIDKTMKLANEVSKDIKDLKKKLVSEKMSDWEKKSLLENIVDKQQTLEQLIKEVADENAERDSNSNTFKKEQLEITQKQEQLQFLMETVMDDEMRKLMEEIQKLRNQMDNKKLLNMAEKLDKSYEDLNKELDRNLELLKQMEVEQKVNSTIDRLQELSKEHEKIADQVKEKKTESELHELKEKLEKQEKELFDIQKNYNETKDKNKDLKQPYKLDDFQEQFDQINKKFEDSKQDLDNKKQSKSSKAMKENSEQMQQLSQQMQKMMQESQMEMNQINMEDLKQVIENLLTFSFKQEALIQNTKSIRSNDPQYQKLMADQHRLIADFRHIEDSLISLSKQVPQLNAPIFKETESIDSDLQSSDDFYEARRLKKAAIHQQLVMTSSNELALLLSEVLDQMQNQQQSQSGKGSKSQGKPKPSAGDLKAKQEQIKKQMQDMLKKMQQGMQQGQSMNKELAKMLSEQEKFEKMLNDMMKNGTISPKDQSKLNQIKKMIEENKKDIYNKKINQESLKRNNRILSRLLEIEKSENQRGKEKKRKATEAVNKKNVDVEKLFETDTLNRQFIESIEYDNLKLKKYYKEKFIEYINQ